MWIIQMIRHTNNTVMLLSFKYGEFNSFVACIIIWIDNCFSLACCIIIGTNYNLYEQMS